MGTKEQTDTALRAALNYLRASRKTHLQELADICGRTRRHLQGIASDKERQSMSGEMAHKIAAFYGLAYEQFLYLGKFLLSGVPGEEALERARRIVVAMGNVSIAPHVRGKGHVEPPNVEPVPMPERGRMVPVISFVQAGEWHTAVDNLHPGCAEDWVACSPHLGPRSFALRVRGPSMEPEFREGDIVVVDPDKEAVSGDYVVAKLEEEEATFKQYVRDSGRDYLIPLNERFQPMDMTGKDWRIVGRVMERVKKY